MSGNPSGASLQQPAAAPASDLVTLSLGDVDLAANKSDLARESDFFRRLFDPTQHEQPNGYGLYRLACRPEPLQVIIDFCQFDTYPLLLTEHSEIDRMAYQRVVMLADAYEVTRLSRWIHNEEYRYVVGRRLGRRMLDVQELELMILGPKFDFGTRLHIFRQPWCTTDDRRCSRGIIGHDDPESSFRCGKDCAKAAERAELLRKEVLVIEESWQIDHNKLKAPRPST